MARRPLAPCPPGNMAARIGILGGSFNPAHEGHRHISLMALKSLGLDEVWWLVSPKNPLKSAAELAGFDERLRRARAVAAHPRIRVSDLERDFPSAYTVDVLARLRRRWPRNRFVWLMGADNLAQFHLWRRWQDILASVPVAVFDRPDYSYAPLWAKAAIACSASRVRGKARHRLAMCNPPAWAFFHGRRNRLSSTAIRRGRA